LVRAEAADSENGDDISRNVMQTAAQCNRNKSPQGIVRTYEGSCGAGRRALFGQCLESRTVTLPEYLVEWLMALGDGNLSAGIWRMAELAR
jgi:hypothetical protein